MNILRSFLQVQSNQDASPLFRLPTEVRLQILQYVVVSDRLIPDMGLHAGEPITPTWVELFCQDIVSILSTCQKVYLEALPIYESENTIQILWNTSRYSTAIYMPWMFIFYERRCFPTDSNEWTRPIVPEFEGPLRVANGFSRRNKKGYRLCWIFKKVIIKFSEFHGPQHVYQMCRMLAEFLKGRHVIIDIRGSKFEGGALALDVCRGTCEYEDAYLQQLGSFREIQELAVSACQNLRELQSLVLIIPWDMDTQHVLRKAVSSEPISDFNEHWKYFHTTILDELPDRGPNRDHSFKYIHRDLLLQLDKAMMLSDDAACARLMVELAERAKADIDFHIQVYEDCLADVKNLHARAAGTQSRLQTAGFALPPYPQN